MGKFVRQYWTAAEIERLRSEYSHVLTADLAAELGRNTSKVYKKAAKLGLKKTAEFVSENCRLLKHAQHGEEYRFQKGHVPANKGLRRPGWAPGRMAETQFRKGDRQGEAARNWKPVGTIRPDPDGYLRIKVREAVPGQEAYGFGNKMVWPLLNRYLWEQHNGPIPPRHIVGFKDGDRKNCVIDNLELISMADNARRNSIWSVYPRELAEAIQLQGALKRRLKRHGEEQH